MCTVGSGGSLPGKGSIKFKIPTDLRLVRPIATSSGGAQGGKADFKDNYPDVNGVRLHYASVGKGPLVLFVHGYPSFWDQWKIRWPRWGAITWRSAWTCGDTTCPRS
jgi:hypothetical protein